MAGTVCLMMELLSEVQQTYRADFANCACSESYAYLDQAPLLEVDVHEGLENTLVILHIN